MADMYGAILSNTFTVRDVGKFRTWFARYHFGDDVQLFVNEKEALRHIKCVRLLCVEARTA